MVLNPGLKAMRLAQRARLYMVCQKTDGRTRKNSLTFRDDPPFVLITLEDKTRLWSQGACISAPRGENRLPGQKI